jgi:hypothetical protein
MSVALLSTRRTAERDLDRTSDFVVVLVTALVELVARLSPG